jgi:multiple sugar transport system permease protein
MASELKARKYNRREAVAGYLFISPWIIGFLIFTLGTMIYSLAISFSHFNLATNKMRPGGLSNYQALFDDPKVMGSLKNTLFFAVLAVPLEIVFALFLAILLNRAARGAGFFRTVFYLPRMTPAVATAAVFLLLLNGNTGAVNRGLRVFGIEARNGWSTPPGSGRRSCSWPSGASAAPWSSSWPRSRTCRRTSTRWPRSTAPARSASSSGSRCR